MAWATTGHLPTTRRTQFCSTAANYNAALGVVYCTVALTESFTHDHPVSCDAEFRCCECRSGHPAMSVGMAATARALGTDVAMIACCRF